MDRVSVNLEHCYGIKKLKVEFDFSRERVYAIYAPNGAMKSSLAETFRDIAAGKPSTDRIFPARTSARAITDATGAELTSDSVFVVGPYDDELGPTEKTATLLVDLALRKEYESLQRELENAANTLLKALKDRSGSKKDLEREISSTFTSSDDEFYTALVRIKGELSADMATPFADIEYDQIFDEKILEFIGNRDAKTALAEYVARYNQLLAASTYFKKGIFDYYNATEIAKTLAKNGFFDAKHTVSLKGQASVEITTGKQLEDVIAKEKSDLLTDKTLRKKFDDFEKAITKNAGLRSFQAYLADNETLLPHLANIKKFKEEVWKSYLGANYELYRAVLDKYLANDARRKDIEKRAAAQRTQWETVVEIFNSRFFVPFKLAVKNRIEVMLGDDPIPVLGFTYHDGKDETPIARERLVGVLSTGERRALYLLNVIFEIEVRRQGSQETLVIVDDIADSFDYQNKYAIIQYLHDNTKDGLFKQIIMTHNFDFFRTIQSRFVSYPHCLMATRGGGGVSIGPAEGIRNIFVRGWKPAFHTDPCKKVACIPFMRNLVEYTVGEADPMFKKLTSLLHIKSDSDTITEADLHQIYDQVFTSKSNGSSGSSAPMLDVIFDAAKSCLTAQAGTNLENKIVLSIAIRLRAERYMINQIKDDAFVAAIEKNQTQTLLRRFKDLPNADAEAKRILDQVVLMTPENIHLNSFMYEPLVDMSDEHLRRLYRDVEALS